MRSGSRRFSLIERTGMTFESFLARDFGSRFYSDEFLTSLSDRRLELHARMGKSAGMAFLFATLIAFFDLVSGSNFSYSGITIQITQDLMPIIALFAAGAFLQLTFAFIDEQIIFRILMKIGSNIGIHNFPLFLIDKAAINLWSDAITPRYFGLKSGSGQKIALYILVIIVLFSSLAMFFYPPAMILYVAHQTFTQSEPRWVAIGISALGCVIVLWALLLGIMSFYPFKFHPADWIESTNQPTEEFATRMREELGASESGEPSEKKEE